MGLQIGELSFEDREEKVVQVEKRSASGFGRQIQTGSREDAKDITVDSPPNSQIFGII